MVKKCKIANGLTLFNIAQFFCSIFTYFIVYLNKTKQTFVRIQKWNMYIKKTLQKFKLL